MTTTESAIASTTDLDKKTFRGPRARFSAKSSNGLSKADQIRHSFDEKNKAINANIDALKNKLTTVSSQIKELTTSSSQKSRRDALKEEVAALGAKKNVLIEQAKPLNTRLRDAREGFKKKTQELTASREKMPIKSTSEIDKKIGEYEKQVDSGRITLLEEKRILAEISKLRRARKDFDKIDQLNAELNALKNETDEAKKACDAKNAEIKKIEEEVSAVYAKIKSLDSQRDSNQPKIAALFTEKEKLRKQIDQEYVEREKGYATYKKSLEDNRAAIEKDRARREEMRRRQDLERQVAALQKDLGDLDVEAFEKEIGECGYLAHYFEQLHVGGGGSSSHDASVSMPTSASAGKAARKPLLAGAGNASPRQVDTSMPTDCIVHRKGHDKEGEPSFMFIGGKKSSAKGAKHKNSSTPTVAAEELKLPLHVLTGLGDLRVPIPSAHKDIDATLATIKAKHEEYMQKRKAEENAIQEKRKGVEAQVEALREQIRKTSNEEELAQEEIASPADEQAK